MLRRAGRLLVLVAVLLLLGGCTPYPDDAVVRRAEGYFARSECPPLWSQPQVHAVTVTAGEDGRVAWAAHVTAEEEFVREILLLESADGLTVNVDNKGLLTPGTPVWVNIKTRTGANGWVSFVWDELDVGEAASHGERLAENDIPAPGLNSQVQCSVMPGWLMMLGSWVVAYLAVVVCVIAVVVLAVMGAQRVAQRWRR